MSPGPPALSTVVPTETSEGRKARIGLQSTGASSLPDTDGWADVKTELAGLDSLNETGAIRIAQNSEDPAHGREHSTNLLSREAAVPEEVVASSSPLPSWALSLLLIGMGSRELCLPRERLRGRGRTEGRGRGRNSGTHCSELLESPASGCSLALPGPGGGLRGVRTLREGPASPAAADRGGTCCQSAAALL